MLYDSYDLIHIKNIVGNVYLINKKGRFAFVGMPETTDLKRDINRLVHD